MGIGKWDSSRGMVYRRWKMGLFIRGSSRRIWNMEQDKSCFLKNQLYILIFMQIVNMKENLLMVRWKAEANSWMIMVLYMKEPSMKVSAKATVANSMGMKANLVKLNRVICMRGNGWRENIMGKEYIYTHKTIKNI